MLEGKVRSLLGVSIGLITGLSVAVLLGSLSPVGFSGFLDTLMWVYTNEAPLVFTTVLLGPIACSSIGLTLAYRARFITVGSEGQVLIGAATTLWFLAYSGLNLNPLVAIPLSMILAGVSATLLGLIPVLLRVYLNANEILTSLMLNYVMLYVVNHLASGPWRIGPFAITRSISDEYKVGPLTVLLVSLLLAIAYWFILTRTRLGLTIEVYGKAPLVAETYGLNPRVTLVSVALISSFTAGIGGALMMLGFQYYLTPMSFSPGYGYMGVLVAWLSGNNPLVALPASWFFSSLLVLGRSLQASGLLIGYVLAIQSIIVLSVLVFKKVTSR